MKEITKELIIKEFKKENLPIIKIRKSKLGGFYVYHIYGSEYSYKKYTRIEAGYDWVKKLREHKTVRLTFIDDEDLLNMAIMEAKLRRKNE